jgi:succinoglycan biosynthesis protein ExoW
MSSRVAIVIPFFQRQRGIVEKAVRSILDQRFQDFEIIVVDDCSPVPAMDELRELVSANAGKMRIIMMEKNGGQGAARNRGLDNVRSGTEYVAFLDSDDEWTNDHLENAVQALDQGYDLYFSDFYQLEQEISAFRRAGRIDPTKHRRLTDHAHLRVYEGDMFSQIITGNILGMSTIVYRFAKYPSLRFREDFRSTGEEYLFWLSLARLTSRIAFSDANECRYGEGVNTYSGATWGREGAVRRIHDEIRYLRAIKREYNVSATQRRNIGRRLDAIRDDFVRELLHRLAKGRPVDVRLLWGIVRMDPLCVPLSIPLAFRAMVDFARSRTIGS